MGNLILKGSHGTSEENALSIQAEGLAPSSHGDFGQGVYFWGDKEYLKELGEAWARYELSQGEYKKAKGLVVLFAKITTRRERLLEIDRNVRSLAAKEMERRGLDSSDTQECSMVFNAVIKMIEDEQGKEFQVLQGEIPLPPKKYFRSNFPYGILTAAICYIVRDVNIIAIENMENISMG